MQHGAPRTDRTEHWLGGGDEHTAPGAQGQMPVGLLEEIGRQLREPIRGMLADRATQGARRVAQLVDDLAGGGPLAHSSRGIVDVVAIASAAATAHGAAVNLPLGAVLGAGDEGRFLAALDRLLVNAAGPATAPCVTVEACGNRAGVVVHPGDPKASQKVDTVAVKLAEQLLRGTGMTLVLTPEDGRVGIHLPLIPADTLLGASRWAAPE